MSMVRLNIVLPEEMVQQLEKLVGPRKKSHFIAEAVRQKIEEIQVNELQQHLEEGYKATKQEGLAMAKEFEPIDLEGWDEY